MTRTRWFDFAAIALAVAVFVGIVGVSCAGGGGQPVGMPSEVTAERLQTAADAPPTVLFIGDSYTEGTGSAEMSYACRAAVQMGWLCALSAVGGTGYISGGPANRFVVNPEIGKSTSFGERVPHLAAKYDPTVVVLDGGRNDDIAPPKDVFAAMVATTTEVHRTWPEAKIILIRPRFIARPDDDLGFDDNFMARVEADPAAQGVIIIDPIGSLGGTNTSKLVSSDGVHPNRQGEQRMTTALVASLVANNEALPS